MSFMPKKFDVLKTTWINLVLTLLILYIPLSIKTFYESYFIDSSGLFNTVFLILIGFFGSFLYWAVFWIPLWILLITIEAILLYFESSSLRNILLQESILFSLILISFAILFKEPFWFIITIAFLLSQEVRKKQILRA